MPAKDEFLRLVKRAGVTVYRKVGKIVVVHDRDLPIGTLRAVIDAVKAFASTLADEWEEWKPGVAYPKFSVEKEVMDDPKPKDVNANKVGAQWLIDRCQRYHFRLTSPEPRKLLGVPESGWDMQLIRKLVPGWFVDVVRARNDEISEHLSGA